MRIWAAVAAVVVAACGSDAVGSRAVEQFCVVEASVYYHYAVKVPNIPDSLIYQGSGSGVTLCVEFAPAASAVDSGGFVMTGDVVGTFRRTGGGLPDTTFTDTFNFPTRGRFEVQDDMLYFLDVDRAQWLEFQALSTRPTSNGGFGTAYFSGGDGWEERFSFAWDRP